MPGDSPPAAASFFPLPADLPIPVNDGACDHLPGLALPSIALISTQGRRVNLATEAREGNPRGRVVVFCYPRTGRPGEDLPPGWDAIPGARGCTPETCGFRDLHAEFTSLSAVVYGLSTQTPEYQRELADRLKLRFEILSDSELEFTRALRLPTFEAIGLTLIKRLTLIGRDGRIEKVFYPIFPPDQHAEEVLDWLHRN